jgi:hypothetical protein
MTAAAKPSWRDVLKIHPAADLFPLMGDDELAELGEDILKHGLREPVVVMRQYRRGADGKFDLREYDLVLLDGRNRLDAMEGAGFTLIRDGKLDKTLGHKALGLEPLTHTGGAYAEVDPDVDPDTYIISANIHRRHLIPEKKRDLITKLLKADPSKSDRQIAEMIKADHKTVGAVRAHQEATGEISPVEKRVGKDGKPRKQPAARGWSRERGGKTQATAGAEMKARGEVSKLDTKTDLGTRDDIGSASTGELVRLRARNEELENKVRRLETENLALRSEVDELKAELRKSSSASDDNGISGFLDRTKQARSLTPQPSGRHDK